MAAALLVRLLVPGGWMLGVTPDGVGLVLCDGVAPAAVAGQAHAGMHHAPAGQDEPNDAAPDAPCVFAGLGVAHGSAAPVEPALPVSPASVSTPVIRPLAPGRGLAAPPPPATGPPALA